MYPMHVEGDRLVSGRRFPLHLGVALVFFIYLLYFLGGVGGAGVRVIPFICFKESHHHNYLFSCTHLAVLPFYNVEINIFLAFELLKKLCVFSLFMSLYSCAYLAFFVDCTP